MKSLLLITIMFFTASSFAASGYKNTEVSIKRIPLKLSLSRISLECTDMNSWGQSHLILQSLELANESFFKIDKVAYLINGACEPVKQNVISKFKEANGTLEVSAQFVVSDMIQWGVFSEGTENEQAFCTRHTKEQVYVHGIGEFNPYSYQGGAERLTEQLPYELCASTK